MPTPDPGNGRRPGAFAAWGMAGSWTGRRVALAIAGLAISAACLYVAFRNVDLGALARFVATFDPASLAAAALAVLGCYVMGALRWRILLDELCRVRFRRVVSILLIAQLMNMTLPFRAGDVMRPALARYRCGIGLSKSFASTALDRLFDVLAVFALALAISLNSRQLSSLLAAQATIIALLVAALAVLILAAFRPGLAVHALRIAARRTPHRLAVLLHRYADTIELLLRNFRDMLEPARLGKAALASFGNLAFGLAAYALVFRASGVAVPPVAILVVLVATQLGAAVPSAPASLGVFHAIVVGVLALWQVPSDAALGIAIVLHALISLLPVALGLAALYLEGTAALRGGAEETTGAATDEPAAPNS